jgi:hypothetical protein
MPPVLHRILGESDAGDAGEFVLEVASQNVGDLKVLLEQTAPRATSIVHTECRVRDN